MEENFQRKNGKGFGNKNIAEKVTISIAGALVDVIDVPQAHLSLMEKDAVALNKSRLCANSAPKDTCTQVSERT